FRPESHAYISRPTFRSAIFQMLSGRESRAAFAPCGTFEGIGVYTRRALTFNPARDGRGLARLRHRGSQKGTLAMCRRIFFFAPFGAACAPASLGFQQPPPKGANPPIANSPPPILPIGDQPVGPPRGEMTIDGDIVIPFSGPIIDIATGTEGFPTATGG